MDFSGCIAPGVPMRLPRMPSISLEGELLTLTGMGNVIEIFHCTTEFDAILGGSEDIIGKAMLPCILYQICMLIRAIGDMAVRQALKNFANLML